MLIYTPMLTIIFLKKMLSFQKTKTKTVQGEEVEI